MGGRGSRKTDRDVLGVEDGDDLLDLHTCVANAVAATSNERPGPRDAIRESVHIHVVALEFLEDRLELGERLGVSQLVGRFLAHGFCSFEGDVLWTVLCTLPSATVVMIEGVDDWADRQGWVVAMEHEEVDVRRAEAFKR